MLSTVRKADGRIDGKITSFPEDPEGKAEMDVEHRKAGDVY